MRLNKTNYLVLLGILGLGALAIILNRIDFEPKKNRIPASLPIQKIARPKIGKIEPKDVLLVKEDHVKKQASDSSINSTKTPQYFQKSLSVLLSEFPNLNFNDDYLAKLSSALGNDDIAEAGFREIFRVFLIRAGVDESQVARAICKNSKNCSEIPDQFYPEVFNRLKGSEFSHMKFLLQESLLQSPISKEEKFAILKEETWAEDTKSNFEAPQYTDEGQVILDHYTLYRLETQKNVYALTKSYDLVKQMTLDSLSKINSNETRLALGFGLIHLNPKDAPNVVDQLSAQGASDDDLLIWMLGPPVEQHKQGP